MRCCTWYVRSKVITEGFAKHLEGRRNLEGGAKTFSPFAPPRAVPPTPGGKEKNGFFSKEGEARTKENFLLRRSIRTRQQLAFSPLKDTAKWKSAFFFRLGNPVKDHFCCTEQKKLPGIGSGEEERRDFFRPPPERRRRVTKPSFPKKIPFLAPPPAYFFCDAWIYPSIDGARWPKGSRIRGGDHTASQKTTNVRRLL